MPEYITLIKEIEDCRREIDRLEKAIDDNVKKIYNMGFSGTTAASILADSLIDQIIDDEEAREQKLEELQALEERLAELDMPQHDLWNLSDETPILLMPVRLQTRFVTVKHVTAAFDRSMVADTASLDSSILTPWTAYLKDLKQDIQINTPGSVFLPTATIKVTAEGTPTNRFETVADKRELWVRIYPDDIFVQTHEEKLTAEEQAYGQNYWREVWKAETVYQETLSAPEDKPSAELKQAKKKMENHKLGAWRALLGSFETARAAWILKQTEPKHSFKLGNEPEFTGLVLKPESWTEAPHTRVLPDRFIIRTYRGNEIKDFVGNPLPDQLTLGFKPNSEEGAEDDFTEQRDTELKLPEYLQWTVNFEKAVEVGMGIKIELDEEEYEEGFDKIVVLGVKTNPDKEENAGVIQELFTNHMHKIGGCAIIPNGTATNNTGKGRAGLAFHEMPPEATLEIVNRMHEEPSGLFDSDGLYRYSDGELLAYFLGLPIGFFYNIPFADRMDIRGAQVMNSVLWPVTLGYALPQQLPKEFAEPGFLDHYRSFFQQSVLGRGSIPSIRIDEQPYGVLATSAFSRWKATEAPLRHLLENILEPLDKKWTDMINVVARIFRKNEEMLNEETVSESFTKILHQHASSVRYFQRTRVGQALLNLLGGEFPPSVEEREILDHFFERFSTPPLVDAAAGFREINQPQPLSGPLIDAAPLSETNTINFDGANYLKWLEQEELENIKADNRPNSLPLLYLLLKYALLRTYLIQGVSLLRFPRLESVGFEEFLLKYLATMDFELVPEVGHTIVVEAENLARAILEAKQKSVIEEGAKNLYPKRTRNHLRSRYEHIVSEKPGIATSVDGSMVAMQKSLNDNLLKIDENKWALLNSVESRLLNSNLAEESQLSVLNNFKNNYLPYLTQRSTAELERLMAESLDVCNYRLDAWWQALAVERLHRQRQQEAGAGLYYGAYGYLENVKKNNSFEGLKVEVVQNPKHFGVSSPGSDSILPFFNFPLSGLPESDLNNLLENSFVYLGKKEPLPTLNRLAVTAIDQTIGTYTPTLKAIPDSDNQGFIPTPSIAHGITSAILKAAHSSYQRRSASEYDPFSVKLDSKRVREALHLLEGIRNGQSLAALLGYRFERAIHEVGTAGFAQFQWDQYIYDFRRAYPIDALSSDNGNEADEAQEAIPPFNVTDGLALVRHYRNIKRTRRFEVQVGSLQENELDKFIYKNESFNGLLPDAPHVLEQLEGSNPNETLSRKRSFFGAIRGFLRQLDHSLDGLSDLLVGESIFQTARGNKERAALALRILSGDYTGAFDLPEIVKIPRNGQVLKQKFVVAFRKGKWNDWSNHPTPRAMVGYLLNTWIGNNLPTPQRMAFRVRWWKNEAEAQEPTYNYANVRASDLIELQPIDFLYMLHDAKSGIGTEGLLFRITSYLYGENIIDEHDYIELLPKDRTDFTDNEVTLFSLSPLIKSLGDLINVSRPLKPSDFIRENDPDRSTEDNRLDYKRLYDIVHNLINANNVRYGTNALLRYIDREIDITETLLLEPDSPTSNTWSKRINLIRRYLAYLNTWGLKNTFPDIGMRPTPENARQWVNHLRKIKVEYENKVEKALDLYSSLPDADHAASSEWSHAELMDKIIEVHQLLLGSAFKIFPSFVRFRNVGNIRNNFNQQNQLLENAGSFALENWLQSLAPVRSGIKTYQHLDLLREALNVRNRQSQLKVCQMPFRENDQWMGSTYSPQYQPANDTLAIVGDYSEDFSPNGTICGLVVEEWTEHIPLENVQASVAMHYDQPNSEAPQTVLLAVSPELTGRWEWEDLVATITDTFEMAKKRAVDPDLIQEHAAPLAKLLPLNMMGIANDLEEAPSLDLSHNNPPSATVEPVEIYLHLGTE